MFLLPMSKTARSSHPKSRQLSISEHDWARRRIYVCLSLLVLLFCVFCINANAFADTQIGSSVITATIASPALSANTATASNIMATGNTKATATREYSDVSPTAWYAPDLRFISDDPRKILEGYSDGKYRPDGTLSVEQFIKCTVAAAGFRPSANGGHWAQPYIDKALLLGIIRSGQFDSFGRGMTRGEMANVIMAGMTAITGESPPKYDEADMRKRMSDFSMLGSTNTEPICRAYSMGILAGYPDGKFHPERILTRAQAIAVIRRMIDASARLKLSPIGDGATADMWSDAEFEAFMSTEEWKNVLNPNPIYGVKNGKVTVYKYEDETTEEIIAGIVKRSPQTLEGALGDMYYQIIKHIVYFARKYDATATVSYSDDLGGRVEFDFASNKPWMGFGSMKCFTLTIYKEPRRRSDLFQMTPDARDIKLMYDWHIECLYKEGDVVGKPVGASPAGYDWSTEKYVQVLKCISSDVFGQLQGDAVGCFIEKNYDITSQSFEKKPLMYIGKIEGCDFDVLVYYPDPLGYLHFYFGEVNAKR